MNVIDYFQTVPVFCHASLLRVTSNEARHQPFPSYIFSGIRRSFSELSDKLPKRKGAGERKAVKIILQFLPIKFLKYLDFNESMGQIF